MKGLQPATKKQRKLWLTAGLWCTFRAMNVISAVDVKAPEINLRGPNMN